MSQPTQHLNESGKKSMASKDSNSSMAEYPGALHIRDYVFHGLSVVPSKVGIVIGHISIADFE